MTSHKHSFQCLEKPALSAGHNFAFPHTIHLEQLDNRRCSPCSESQQVKPRTLEVSENQPASCYQSQSPSLHQHKPRRPIRPEGDPVHGVEHQQCTHHHPYHTHRHRKRIVLVKNGNPSIQRTILLPHKPVYSLSFFMDDVSELMQCLIRKLYTLDGCKVDSVQSILHGPSILVCVGHEPFQPLLLNRFQKNSEDKLPKLILKSQSRTCNEDQGYKKNVNFGLKSKKKVPPGPFPKARENMMLDDAGEKRVLVNKDGSLLMEMSVRLRLLNDESLHCSTKITKCSCTSNMSFLGEDNMYYSHCGHSESCSDTEQSLPASEAEDICITKRPSQKHSAELHCQHCHTHGQEYDVWTCLRRLGSASLNVSSHKLKCKKECLDGVHNTSCDEYTEEVAHKGTCVLRTSSEVEAADSIAQYCTVSRCSSLSEVCSVSTMTAGYTDHKDGKNESTHAFCDKHRNNVSAKDLNHESMNVQITHVSIGDKRPLSSETSSSDIMASFKEDEEKDETDLSPVKSRASQSYKQNVDQTRNAVMSQRSFIPCKPLEPTNHSLLARPSIIALGCSAKSKPSRKVAVKETQENVSTSTHKSQNKDRTDVAIENGTTVEKYEAIDQSEDFLDESDILDDDMRTLISKSDLSKTCDDQREYSSPNIMSDKSSISEASHVQSLKIQSDESISALSTKTNISARSMASKISEGTPADMDNKLLLERAPSAMSDKSDVSVTSKSSNILATSPYGNVAVEALSAKSNKSNASLRSNTLKRSTVGTEEAGDLGKERLKRPSGVNSSKSTAPERSTKSKLRDKKDNSTAEKTQHLQDNYTSDVTQTNPGDSELSNNSKHTEDMLVEDKSGDFVVNLEGQASQRRSSKFNSAQKSEMFGMLETISSSVSIKSENCNIFEADEECDYPEERPASVMSSISVKSKQSVGSDERCENKEAETKQTGRKSHNAFRSRMLKASGASRQDVLKAYEDITDVRPVNALPSKSQKSYLSIKSKDLPQENAPTSMSLKSNGSTKSSKVERASGVSNSSAVNLKKSLADISPAEMEHENTERNVRAVSRKSDVSKTSKENSVLRKIKESMNTSEEKLVERSPRAKSAKSNTTVGSKSSDAQSMENIPQSSTSPDNEKSNWPIISNYSPNDVKSDQTWDIMIEQSVPCDISDKSSDKPNISALSDGQTDALFLNERPESDMSGLKILMTEVLNNADIKARTSSALFNKTNSSSVHHRSESVSTPSSASVSIGTVEEYDDDNDEEDNSVSFISVNSTPQLNTKSDLDCNQLSKTTGIENQQQMTKTPDDASKTSLNVGTITSDKCTNSLQPVTDNEVANNTFAKKHSKKPSGRSSAFESSKTKAPPEETGEPQNITTNTPMYLEINGQNCNATAKCNSAGKRLTSNLSSVRYSEKIERNVRLHSANLPISSELRKKFKESVFPLAVSDNRSPSNENGSKSNTTRDLNISCRTCNESLVATDASRNINDNKNEKNSISRHSTSSLAQKRDNNPSELVPSILPSSSLNEIVNEWLKKIPLDSALYDVEDEYQMTCQERELVKMSGKMAQYEKGNGREGDSDARVFKPGTEKFEEITNNESKLGDIKEFEFEESIQPCMFHDVPTSVHLMKILLRPRCQRCNSLPELSPVYGRKLSMSAKGFLDSLVNLQLLDFDTNDVNGKAKKYHDLMNMLQTLWLCDNHDSVTPQRGKFNIQQTNDELNVKSEVNVNKINENLKSQANPHGEGFETQTKTQATDKTENEIETKSDSATPDIPSQVQWTPVDEGLESINESNVLSIVSDFVKRNNYSFKEPTKIASKSNKSSGIDSSINRKLTDHEEDTHSESSSAEKSSHFVENVSHNPDPVWVLNILNNVEKEFMTHYVTAMADFKTRWNLNNNEQLDAMIGKLRDEIHKRIQASINNELRKIQGHVGRPRPPKESMSRKSGVLTEQKRRRVKVNLSQAVAPSVKDTIIEKEEIWDNLADGSGYVESETVSEEHATEKNEDAERESTDGKGTEVEILDKKPGVQTVENKTLAKEVSIVERKSEGSQSESEAWEIPDDEKEMYEDTKTEATWKNMPQKPDIATGAESYKKEDDRAVAEKCESTDSKERVGNESDIIEQESAKEANPINDESAKEGETDNDELDAKRNTIKAETAEDKEAADSETDEYRDKLYNNSSDRTEIIKVKTGETAEVNMADIGGMSEAEAAKDNDYESAKDIRTSKAQTAVDTSDDDKAEYVETPKAKIAGDGEMSDGDEVDVADGADYESKSEIAEESDTGDDDDEISEIEENPYEDGETAGTVVEEEEEEEIAEATENRNNHIDNDDDGENAEVTVKEKEIVDNEIVGDAEAQTNDLKQFVGNEMKRESVQKTKGGPKDSAKTANGQTNNDETLEDTKMDSSQSEGDGETPDDELDYREIAEDDKMTPNDNTASDDETADDGETSNGNCNSGEKNTNGSTVDDEKRPGSVVEEVDEMTGTETAVDGKQGDEITDDEETNGTEKEGNEETAEVKISEDGDTADETESVNERLSEHKLEQNGDIDEAFTENGNESLVTDGELNGETNDNNTDEEVINTNNIQRKPNSEMLRANVNAASINAAESDEGGAEDEDETEPIVETNGRVQKIKKPAMQPTPRNADIKRNSIVKMYPSSEDGDLSADADSEESDTDVYNIYGRK